jgi:hypothetical protein
LADHQSALEHGVDGLLADLADAVG